jgi:hypothetical protein
VITKKAILPISFCLLMTVNSTHNLYAADDVIESIFSDIVGIKIPPGDQSKKVKAIPYAELKEAMYGIPLSATIDEVVKWCETNSASIKNNSAAQIKQYIEEQAKIAPAVAEAMGNYINKTMTYDERKEQEAREELYKAIAPSLPDNIDEHPEMKLAFGANYADVMKQQLQQEAAVNIKNALELMKCPSFAWNNDRYFLQPVFPGIKFPLGNEQLLCADDRITKTSYVMKIEPNEQMSQRLLKNINIYFYVNRDGGIRSYAVSGFFTGEKGEDTTKDVLMQIMDTLEKKYGKPKTFMGNLVQGETDNVLLLINENLIGPVVFWKRNILAKTTFENFYDQGNTNRPGDMQYAVKIFASSGFEMLYYDSNLAQELINLRITAIKEQIEKKSKQADSLKKGIEQAF